MIYCDSTRKTKRYTSRAIIEEVEPRAYFSALPVLQDSEINYTFDNMITTSNSDGVWNKTDATVSFRLTQRAPEVADSADSIEW